MAQPTHVKCPMCPPTRKALNRSSMLGHFKSVHPDLVPEIPAGRTMLPRNWWDKIKVPGKGRQQKLVVDGELPKIKTRRVIVEPPTTDGIMDAVLRAIHGEAVPRAAIPAIAELRTHVDGYLALVTN